MSTNDQPQESAFERKLRERAAARGKVFPVVSGAPSQPVAGQQAQSNSPKPFNPADDAPSAEEFGLGMSPEQEALDNAIKGLGIIAAYDKWAGKGTVKAGSNQTEGIKVRCPNPQHVDRNPSAWINSKKGVFHCAACEYGGDVWDIAAWHFGFPVPGYKNDPTQFRQLREKIGIELGFQVVQGINGTIVVPPAGSSPTQPGAVSGPTRLPAASGTNQGGGSASSTGSGNGALGVSDDGSDAGQSGSKVGLLPAAAAAEASKEEYEENQKSAPSIDWKKILGNDGTFLDTYMWATSVDTSPEEYHFWNGLIALGMAIGRDVTLNDSEKVIGNLFVCLTGPSSAGKSRSKRHLGRLLRMAVPYDNTNPASRGAKIIKAPGSAEYLITTFQSTVEDPVNPKKLYYMPVRGVVDYEELSTMMATSSRQGSAVREQLMDLYDSPEVMESGSQGSGLRHAELPCGSVISTTQNRSLRRLLDSGDDGSGFINRWVFAQGKLKQRVHMGGAEVDLVPASHKLVQIHQWAVKNRSLDLTPEADKAWYEFFHQVVAPAQAKADEQGTAVIARMDLMMKKLFLLFACNNLEEVVSERSVNQALELWPYLLATFGIVHKEMRKTQLSDLQDEVLKQIARLTNANGRPPSRKNIYDAVKRKVTSTEELMKLIQVLVKMDLIIEVASPAGSIGRPTVRYQLNA